MEESVKEKAIKTYNLMKENIIRELDKLSLLHHDAMDSREGFMEYIKQAEIVSETLLVAERGIVLITSVGIELMSAGKKKEDGNDDKTN